MISIKFILNIASTMQDVQLELAKSDAILAGQGGPFVHKSSLTSFITQGLELEEQQYVSSSSLFLFSLMVASGASLHMRSLS